MNKRNFHGLTGTKFHRCFYHIVDRCRDETNMCYGGRGIKCLWDSFEEFRIDMYESYLKHAKEYGDGRFETTIDRIDTDGNYCKNNCRWITKKEQEENKRHRYYIYRNNKKIFLTDLAKETGEHVNTIIDRFKRGLSFDKIIEHKTKHKDVEINGIIKNIGQWADHYGISKDYVYKRYAKGLDIKTILGIK